MKFSYLVLLLGIFSSCSPKVEKTAETPPQRKEILSSELQTILDASNVRGVILVYDLQEDAYYANDFDWAEKGRLPASTFKIPNSIIALETGVVENDSTLFKWDGQKRYLKIWEQDLLFREAFQLSCVPCYQDVARRIGPERMKEYLQKLQYGNMVVDTATIDLFWLEGASEISPFQEIDFLKRFYLSELPISKRTETMVKSMMVIETTDQYKLSGKTGWTIRNGHNNGWFVGFVETSEKVYFFATNIEPSEAFNMDMFAIIRREITEKGLKAMGFIQH